MFVAVIRNDTGAWGSTHPHTEHAIEGRPEKGMINERTARVLDTTRPLSQNSPDVCGPPAWGWSRTRQYPKSSTGYVIPWIPADRSKTGAMALLPPADARFRRTSAVRAYSMGRIPA